MKAFSDSTEKNILIGLGLTLAFGLGVLFLSFADWGTQNMKAAITETADETESSNDETNATEDETIDDTETTYLVQIEKGYMLGGNILYRTGEGSISLGISSEGSINEAQSIEIEMIEGEINIQNYSSSFSKKRFILQEFIDSSSVSKIMEDHGDKNWAALYIPFTIPDYGYSQMPNGSYTIVASVHRDNENQSQIFIPVTLKDSLLSCDINSDGFENMIDIILSLKIMNGEITPSADEKEKLDSNHNGILDLVDTITVFKCILNPPPAADTYFENSCKKSDDPIDILLCPTGQLPNIRNVTVSYSTDDDGNTTSQTEVTYTPDPISSLLGQ